MGLFREAVFTLAGTIIGAGIFALPYFTARLGVAGAIGVLAAAVLANVWLSIAYLRVFLDTRGESLEDAARVLLGPRGEKIAHAFKMSTVTLIMYIYVSGVASMLVNLSSRLAGVAPPEQVLRVLVLATAAIVVAARPSSYARLVSALTEWLAVLMLLVSVAALASPPVKGGAPTPSYPVIAVWGPALFSTMDALTMPNIYHILRDERATRRAVIGAYTLVAALYALFLYSMLHAFDSRVADIAVKSFYRLAPLGNRGLGHLLYLIGSVVVVLAMLTSLYNFGYLAGYTMEEKWGLGRRAASLALACLLLPSTLLPKSFAVVMHVLSTIAITIMVLSIVALHVVAEARAGRLNTPKLVLDALLASSVIAGAASLLTH